MAIHKRIKLAKKEANGYVIPLGPFNLVAVVTDKGMLSCGAFDVIAMDRHGYPAARVKSAKGDLIASIDDLMAGTVKDANAAAIKLGIKMGMSVKEALDKI
jgi:uncharacterized protein YunC (DUF1805 family)